MTLAALLALGVQPPEQWLWALLTATRRHMWAGTAAAQGQVQGQQPGAGGAHGGRFSPLLSNQALGLLVYCVAHLRVRPPPGWVEAALAEVEARAVAAGDGMASSSGGGGGGGGGQVEPLDPRVVSGVLRGLAEAEWPLPTDWLWRLLRCTAAQLAALPPGERTKAYMAVVSLDAALAERAGYNFGDLVPPTGVAGGAGAELRAEGAAEGAGQQRMLFTRSRAGW